MIDPYAYAAGFVDADGHISIHHQKGTAFAPRVDIVNANMTPLLALQETLGGTIYVRKHKPQHSQTYNLSYFSREEVSRVLGLLMPYLIGKQDIALLVKEFCDSRIATSPKRGSNTPYSDREKQLYEQVKVLGSKFYKKPIKENVI